MNLPFVKNFNKKVLPSYFLVLVLRDEKVNAVIFEELESKVRIIGQDEEFFTSSIDDISSDDFLKTLDTAIGKAESSLPENIQTHKTIFGVKENWTENDQIKKEYLAKLKRTSEELDLTPIGFLVVSQAISHLLQKEEGAPISAVLVEVNKKSITVTLIKAGKIIETKTSEIHDSIPFTVDTLLKHFNIPEILPSRIIIFNGKEDLSQEFINHTWSKSLPFLHIPQITSLPSDFDAKSVLFGAATQMGFEVLEKDIPKKISDSKATPLEVAGNQDENDFVKESENNKNLKLENFGFSKDVDVAKIKFQEETPIKNEQNIGMKERNHEIDNSQKIYTPRTGFNKENKILTITKSFFTSLLVAISTILQKLNIKNPMSFFSNSSRRKPKIIIALSAFLIFALIASYFLFVKATVEITIDPQITEKNEDILFSTINQTNPSENIIKGEFISISEDGTISTKSTGKKEIGTEAKGVVTIFNSNTSKVTIPSGTIITSSNNNLEFSIDDSIEIASASSDPFTGIKPTTKDVNITAEEIGQEYNLPSNTKFSVEDFDLVAAKNDNPLSGGTKKEIKVVSEEDTEKLRAELPKQLEEKARENLEKQIGGDKILLPVFVSNSLSKESLSAEVEDETDQLTLQGTVEYQGIVYNQNDLITFSKSLLEKDILETQEIDYNNIKTDVKDIQSEDEEGVEANLTIKALLVPKINKEQLAKEIKGKSFREASDLLYKLEQIADVDIFLFPKIPFLPQTIPMMEKNIEISLKNG